MSENGSSASKDTAPKPGGFGGRMGGPGHGMAAPGEKAKDFRATFRKLLTHLAPYRLKIILVLFLAAFSSTFSILGPKIMGWGMTKLVEGLLAWWSGVGPAHRLDYIGRCWRGLSPCT